MSGVPDELTKDVCFCFRAAALSTPSAGAGLCRNEYTFQEK